MTDYSKISDLEINRAIAKQIGGEILFDEYGSPYRLDPCAMSAYSGRDFDEVEFDPCNNPADAWPIIIWSMISLCANRMPNGDEKWFAMGPGEIYMQAAHKNPLRAAMIVFLMMKEAENV